jgi:hypothetical protein
MPRGGPSASRVRRLRAYGALAGLAFLAHAGHHVFRGSAWDVLWLCNLAPLLLAIGCLRAKCSFVAVALLWETLGTPLWLLNVVTGASWIPTSPLVHLACPIVAFLAVLELGWPRGAGYKAMLAMAALALLTRVFTPPSMNVNVAFAVRAGWEAQFPRYEVFAALVFGGGCAIFFVADRLYARAIAACTRRGTGRWASIMKAWRRWCRRRS